MNRYEKDVLLKELKVRLMDMESKLNAVMGFFGIEKERNPFNIEGMTDEMKDDCVLPILNVGDLGKNKKFPNIEGTKEDCAIKGDIKSLLDRFSNDEKARIFMNQMCTEYWRRKFIKL